MTEIAARVRRYVDRHQLWPHGGRVVAAVSGGSDSVSMLFLLRELHDTGVVSLAGMAHLNHQLREHAARDEDFCRTLAQHLDLPFVVDRLDVAALARGWRCSVEVAARRARYAFLERARQACHAQHIAVAHTRDDQAETVLLRLMRGAGTRGLRGVLPARGAVVRPLLDCGRDELRRFLRSRGESWQEDETNADCRHPRNRVRHELLPLLETHYRRSVVQILARTADVAAHDDALLDELAAAARAPLVTHEASAVRLDAAGLRALPVALQRRVAGQVLRSAGATRPPAHRDIERLVAACADDGPRAAQIAGLRVERFSAGVVLLREGRPVEPVALPTRELPVPGVVDLPECGAGCRIVSSGPIRGTKAAGQFGPRVLLKAQIDGPLAVRGRHPGDRIQPVGLDGTKKLQDLFVDRKVPRHDRERVPVVTDASGRLIWVVGHAVAAHAAPSQKDDVIVLTFEQPGESGSEAT